MTPWTVACQAPVFWYFPVGAVVKNLSASAEDARDVGLIPELERSSGVGNGSLLQYFGLENSMDRAAWQVTVHGVTESQTQLGMCRHTRTHTHTHTHTRFSRRLIRLETCKINLLTWLAIDAGCLLGTQLFHLNSPCSCSSLMVAGLLPILMAGLLPILMAGIQAVASEVRVQKSRSCRFSWGLGSEVSEHHFLYIVFLYIILFRKLIYRTSLD